MGMYLDVAGVCRQPLEIRFIYEGFKDSLPDPDSLVASTAEAPMRILPVTVFGWQVSPWRPGVQYPEDRVDKLPGIPGVAAPTSLVPDGVRLYHRPCCVCEVVSVLFARHLPKPPALVSLIIPISLLTTQSSFLSIILA